jgi:hypothetical protein
MGWLRRRGSCVNHLERIALLRHDTLLTTGGARTCVAQGRIGITAFVPVIPLDTQGTLVITLNFYRKK